MHDIMTTQRFKYQTTLIKGRHDEKKSIVLSVQVLFGETVMILKGNSVGSALLADALLSGGVERSKTSVRSNVSKTGLSKVTRSGNWDGSADTVQGSFIK